MNKDKKLLLVGAGSFGEVAYEYFAHESRYQVVGFSAEAAHIHRPELFGLPVVPLETVEEMFPPSEHEVFVAVVYTQLNRLRTRLAGLARSKGYQLASYVSPKASVWRNVKIGEHCFIFENNTLQPFVEIGSNVVLWSGNHIGHHSRIRDNCFVSSQVVISGCCDIGENCFLGVNSTVANGVSVARDCWIGPGVTIKRNVPENVVFGGAESEASKVPATRLCRVKS